MSFFDYITAFMLLLFALSAIIALSFLILSPFSELLVLLYDSFLLSQAEKIITAVDKETNQNQLQKAARLLKKSIVYNQMNSPLSLARLRVHNQNILSRCLIISEEAYSRPSRLAEVEDLLAQRSELLELLFRVKESYNSVKFRRQSAGKNMLNWGKKDFETRRKQIFEELKTNSSKLKTTSKELFDSLLKPFGQDIVYH